ncbi:PTS sugar transporter subunit IIA [Lacticaseibacillus jixianensis]|uniref:PTS sugar transporter subunit IIA n=1 Tax=Lacticaseibacillus jixianensis TaxID=2486012 RepID=A0ABW4B8D6_9LACO|nr:PTS sugar transporter subunit IIA [Lacticaseibacillus jixianensis]
MFGTLFRKPAMLNVELADGSELGAIETVATEAAKALKLSPTAVRASILASEVQGAQFAGERAAILYASCDELKAPRSLLVSLKTPVAWGFGATAHPVDQLVVLAMPNDSPAAAKQAMIERLRHKLAHGVPTDEKAAVRFANSLLTE